MESRLGLYDLLARLVPGGFLLWGLAWMAGQAGLEWLLPNGMSSASQAIAFVLVAYVLGLVAHAVGDWVIEAAIYRVKGKPSEQYLADDPTPSRKSRVWIRESMQALAPSASLDFSGDPESKKRASHEAFRLALNYVERAIFECSHGPQRHAPSNSGNQSSAADEEITPAATKHE
ncbi:MAG: hypothetical protein Q7R48_04040 [bacterium]|nr:hypothetical protein [bacterium]